MPEKLYQLLRDFRIPELGIRQIRTSEASDEIYSVKYSMQPAVFAMTWPDGRPAMHAEMFLMEIATRLTLRRTNGGSLKDKAVALSHLLRFAYAHSLELWMLTDTDIKNAIRQLQIERDPRRPHKNRRNSNTIDTIVSVWIDFLRWLQTNVVSDRIIIGTQNQRPQIPLVERTFTERRTGIRRTILKYRYVPAPSTAEHKGPISRELRTKLWDAIGEMADPARASARFRGRFLYDRNHFEFVLDFLRRRRELQIELLEYLGRRPAELAHLRVSENTQCIVTGKCRVVTFKRRRSTDPPSDVPIPFQVALHLELFIKKYRSRLLDYLASQGVRSDSQDRVFIALDGHALTEETLQTEFYRIARKAGITDQRACMSMFRHRFITRIVAIHLKSFMSDNPGKGKSFITESDYLTVLTRVRPLTGHGNIESLIPYLDLAWKELGVFDDADFHLDVVTEYEVGIDAVSALLTDARQGLTAHQTLFGERVVGELEKIRTRLVDAAKSKRQTHP